MSRNVHATQRLKEEAAYNLRRQEEIEAKKLPDATYASVQRAAALHFAGQLRTQPTHEVGTLLRNYEMKLDSHLSNEPRQTLRVQVQA